MEIERQFFIKEFPTNLPLIESAVFYQGYLSVDPEIRIREKQLSNGTANYKLCFKSSGTLSREEKEVELTKEQYFALKQYIKEPLISKFYMSYHLPNDLVLETSLVDGDLPSRYMYAEIEFKTEEDANSFVPLDIFTEEVTYKTEHKMKNYWRRTRLNTMK